jgi:type II secretory pathway component PulL
MRNTGIVLSEFEQGWQLFAADENGPTEILDRQDPSDVVSGVQLFAEKYGLTKDKIGIALATDSVLFASIPTKELQKESLTYVLESYVPLDAENIVADTLAHRGREPADSTASIAVEVYSLQALVDALEAAGCHVQFIVPQSLLALDQVIDKRLIELRRDQRRMILWSRDPDSKDPSVELMHLDSNGNLLAWQKTSCDSRSIDRQRTLWGVEPTCLVEVADRSKLSLQFAVRILQGKAKASADLRRNRLAAADPWRHQRAAWSMLTLAAIFFVVVLCGSLLWSAMQYQSLALEYTSQQAEMFRANYPGQRIPAAILSRVKSEHARAIGARKSHTLSAVPDSALNKLRTVLESLEEQFPFEIQEIRVDHDRLAMEVKFLSQKDAGEFAATLASRGLHVEPPSVSLVDGDRILASFSARVPSLAPSPALSQRAEP